ncbi:hypothetical protein H4R24_001376 [Coemansia sp. RSA 988]|nr:hypothetical protein H4R24_001376 [Coemansia sp. RSA 988]
MRIEFVFFTLATVSKAMAGSNIGTPMAEVKRQMPGGMPGIDGMNKQDSSPYAAFWNQGIVPGQGFPQVGMSAYGYGLPELGLGRYLDSDALILAGAGEGEINKHDLKNLDKQKYGYDQFKDNKGRGSKPDPAYPGCFNNENCNNNGNSVGHVDDSYNDRPDKTYHYYHDSAAAKTLVNIGNHYSVQLVAMVLLAGALCA